MAPTLRVRKPGAPAPAPIADKIAPPPKAKPKAKTAAKPKANDADKDVGDTKPTKGKPTSKAAATTTAPKKKASSANASAAAKGKAAAVGKSPKPAAKVKTTKAAPKSKPAPKSRSTTKPPPKSTTTAVLDHTVYPHIFDLIVSSAPHGSLLALRAASHALLERCDALLARHIVLGPGLPPPKGKKWDALAPYLPRGPEKKRGRHLRTNLTSATGALPGWVCDLNHLTVWAEDSCGEQCTTLRERWAQYFADDTQVLDLHPWLNSGQRFTRAKEMFKNVPVARFYPYTTERLPVPCDSVVVFTSFTPVQEGEWTRVTSTPGVYLESESEVQRLVFHARLDCRRPTLTECWINLPTQFRGWSWPHAVVILEAEPGSPTDPNPEWNTENPRQNGVLWDVANTLRVGSKTPFVVVGASELPHQICGLTHDPARTHEQFAQTITDNVVAWIRDDYGGRYRPEPFTDEREDEIRAQLRFVTTAEYRAEVGEEQWAIDAVRTVKPQ